MKMNWGKGIAISLVLFMAFILVLAINLMMHSADLESADYYQKEIAYESEIVSLNNAKDLAEKPEVSVTETHLLVQFPANGEFTDSQIMLNRPNDKNQDVSFKIQDTKTFTVDKTTLNEGVYNVILSYSFEGKQCLQKSQLYI
ncbi:MAG: FixH family protein [Crocinitomicaceae bacterium]